MTSRKERTTSGIAGNKFCLRNIANATAKALAHLLATGLLSHSLSGCVREIDEVQHSSSCGECNESEYLMEDLKALLLVVKHFEEVSATSSATASTSTAASSRARRSATTSNVDSTTNRNKRSTTTPTSVATSKSKRRSAAATTNQSGTSTSDTTDPPTSRKAKAWVRCTCARVHGTRPQEHANTHARAHT